MDAELLPVVEIFESLQGEGYNTGMQAVFLRLGRCNLACPWCDTNYDEYRLTRLDEILDQVLACEARRLILTGGEPFIHQSLGVLLESLKDAGFWLAVETNGLRRPPDDWLRRIDYVAVSPKALYAELYDDENMLRRADEVRIVVDGDVLDFCQSMRGRIEARRYFLSPCERQGRFNVEETVRLLGALNHGLRRGKWLLSLQTHKLGSFR